jgi:hypothetical protein
MLSTLETMHIVCSTAIYRQDKQLVLFALVDPAATLKKTSIDWDNLVVALDSICSNVGHSS